MAVIIFEEKTFVKILRQTYHYPHATPQEGLEFPGGGGCVRQKKLEKSMKLNWNFKRCWNLRKKSLVVGMDIFWNYTIRRALLYGF